MQVSFIIPVFNQLPHTQACVRSLKAHVPPTITHEVIWVNDGSEDPTVTFLDTLRAPHRTVHLESNQGFATATNAGADQAVGDWLCLLNNDVELTEGALAEMLRVADATPDAGMIGNIQVTSQGNQVDHAGIEFVDGGYPLHRRGELADLQAEGKIVRVSAVTAACCLVRRDWFINVGGLDTRYRNGFEDVDLCLRARESGWGIYVATRSVVRHAVSTSQGRGRNEYRNARKFLNRWGPRTAALEQAEKIRQARQVQVARAQVGGQAPPLVQAARQSILHRDAERKRLANQPVTVWVDLMRMEPRGANGGIKPLVYGFLEEMTQLKRQPMRFVLLAQPGLTAELTFLRPTDCIATRSGADWELHQTNYPARAITPAELERTHSPEVLYCPFGTSAFARPDLPMVALLVDSLHRDLPSALPIEEVNFREDNFKRTLGAATWVQTLAQHGTARLQQHFNIPATRCFHTYASVQHRLSTQATGSLRPASLPATDFFFYPANFWPHKNHEVLLAAYQHYLDAVGDAAWPLLLTGHPDERMHTLQQMSAALGLEEQVIFAGHLPDDAFKTVWQFAGALVFPSLHEGFGIPVAEAFQSGLPVLAAETSVLPEVGQDACLWFDPRDPRLLSGAMQRMSTDSTLRQNLRERGTAQLPRFSRHFEALKLNHFLHAAARDLVP